MSQAPEIKGKLRDFAQFMLNRRGKFVSRDELLVQVFNFPAGANTRTIETHIQRLLRAVGDQEEICLIRSRQRHGYMLTRRPGGDLTC